MAKVVLKMIVTHLLRSAASLKMFSLNLKFVAGKISSKCLSVIKLTERGGKFPRKKESGLLRGKNTKNGTIFVNYKIVYN